MGLTVKQEVPEEPTDPGSPFLSTFFLLFLVFPQQILHFLNKRVIQTDFTIEF